METPKAENPELRRETPEVRFVDAREDVWHDAGEGLRRILENVGPKTGKEDV